MKDEMGNSALHLAAKQGESFYQIFNFEILKNLLSNGYYVQIHTFFFQMTTPRMISSTFQSLSLPFNTSFQHFLFYFFFHSFSSSPIGSVQWRFEEKGHLHVLRCSINQRDADQFDG
ncbi:hypothetical protein CRE_15466 [Caenorhabditis remanei]|uniref:Uncharacterized protein n=1 Tax=Caenorhabditis remanei TaxID=31234 RepID=E3MSS2_CAERE|nr:hypothetical protein CRE_15466 [Caenorhabditis remanei]